MDFLHTLIVVVLTGILILMLARRVTILEYEKGLKYAGGRFKKVLGPGRHWYIPLFTIIQKMDARARFVTISGQELLTADGVTIKISLAVNYEIEDCGAAVNKVKSFQEALYLVVQVALREVIGSADIESVLKNRNELSKALQEKAVPAVKALGLSLVSVSIKDITFPGALKEIFAQVVSAKQQGLAALEKARGESAALRNLANAARMLDANPNLLQLRMIQAMGESTGNTYILGMPGQGTLIPVKNTVNVEP